MNPELLSLNGPWLWAPKGSCIKYTYGDITVTTTKAHKFFILNNVSALLIFLKVATYVWYFSSKSMRLRQKNTRSYLGITLYQVSFVVLSSHTLFIQWRGLNILQHFSLQMFWINFDIIQYSNRVNSICNSKWNSMCYIRGVIRKQFGEGR